LLGLFFNLEDRRYYVPPKCQLAFNRLHSTMSQKTELFITLEGFQYSFLKIKPKSCPFLHGTTGLTL
jgi:hypothetical protein